MMGGVSHDIDNDKRALRADLRERRQVLSEAQRDAAAEGVRTQLDALVDGLGARSISCFLSTSTEPGTREFVASAVGRGIRVLLPVTRADGLLDWVVATEEGDVAEGLFGLPEPVGELLGPIAVNDVDLMIIPAAAIDRSGMRLGWGRGYFDKTIGSMQRCPPVYAVVFDSEILDEVPRDVHDQPVSGAVTPARTVTFAPTRR
jgi:5-formyltetrahydrofolate cyclo-ligase